MLTWLRPRRRGPPPFHLPAIERARSAAAVPLQASWPPRPTDISFNSRHVLQQATRSHKHLTLKLISRCMSLSRALRASVGDEHFARELIEQSAGHPCGAHVDQGCTEGILQHSHRIRVEGTVPRPGSTDSVPKTRSRFRSRRVKTSHKDRISFLDPVPRLHRHRIFVTTSRVHVRHARVSKNPNT